MAALPAAPVESMTAGPVAQEPRISRRERLQALVDGQYRLIWRLLRRLGIATAAVDDATQQVFLIAAERLDDIRTGSERAFLFGTALRVAQGLRRRLGREQSSDETELRACPRPSPDELTDQKRARELLDELLDELPLDLRTVFILFELEGLSSPEIAEVADIPLGTVASRLRRARDRFRQLLEQRTASRGGPR